MRLTHLLLCLCSSFLPLLAYPSDYDETTYGVVVDAQNKLFKIINETDFESQLEQFNAYISEINNKTYDIIKENLDSFSQHLLQVEKSVTDPNVNITACLDGSDFAAEEFYKFYTNDCEVGATTFRDSVIEVGRSERDVALRKYEEIANYFNDCVNFTDPDPRICAGVLESTTLEISRIKPGVEANPLRVEGQLKQQILELDECGFRHTVVTSKKLQNQFNKVRLCVVDKINAS